MKNSGFTLVELMVVIIMIGILATATIPSYHNKINRTKVEASESYVDVAIEGVEQFYKKTGKFPKNNSEAGLPESYKFVGNYITALRVKDGVIHVTYGNKISRQFDGFVISVRPAIVEGAPRIPIAWIYGNGSVPEKLTVVGENLTTFPSDAMPFEYRY